MQFVRCNDYYCPNAKEYRIVLENIEKSLNSKIGDISLQRSTEVEPSLDTVIY